MSAQPKTLNDKTEIIQCPCGTLRLCYKSESKRYCSKTCLDKYRPRGQNKGKKLPRRSDWKPSDLQIQHGKTLASKVLKGKPLSEDHKAKLREASKKNWEDPEYREKVLGSRGEWTDARRDQVRDRMVSQWAEGFFDNRKIYVQSGHGYHAGVWMRCLNSEGVFARAMDEAGILWQYEPRRFRLSWCTYTPDFYLPELDVWVEVKGFLTETSKKKMESFRRETGKTLALVMQRELPTMTYGGD